tara:strand:+ start:3490 stop:3630 length:141 start_codon:yes stop_codon:yes gene_type:complete
MPNKKIFYKNKKSFKDVIEKDRIFKKKTRDHKSEIGLNFKDQQFKI